MNSVFAVTLAALVGMGCASSAPAPAPTTHAAAAATATAAAPAEPSVLSTEILAREPVANTATVKHILISWADLADAFGGQVDPRAAKRTKADAEATVRSILKQIQAGGDFETLMKSMSEDVGSARSNRAFTVTPDAQLVIEFRQLSLRLHPGEVGVCKSDFGFHIIKRLD
jgi:PBP1b-binding outer membrane lipoprotein LpoB